MKQEKSDVYQRITDRIVSELEQGVRPWLKPWNAEHAAGRITRPLRCNGVPYQGINIIMLWSAAVAAGFAAPIWMTFRQAQEMGAHVRKGEKGNHVVYADRIRRTETDEATGEEAEREIPFMKGYIIPVVKLFTPDAGCTWLLSELDPEDPDIAFGLCDLGMGCPELGTVRISELESVRGKLGLPVERDRHFTAMHTLSVYARAAWNAAAIHEDAFAAFLTAWTEWLGRQHHVLEALNESAPVAA